MSTDFSNSDTPITAFQLKGTMLAITVFEISHLDLSLLEQQLIKKINEAPEFFKSIPMVLAFTEQLMVQDEQLVSVIQLLKQHMIQLLAIRTDDESLINTVQTLGYTLLPPNGAREKLIEIAVNRPAPLENEATKTVETPSAEIPDTSEVLIEQTAVEMPVESDQPAINTLMAEHIDDEIAQAEETQTDTKNITTEECAIFPSKIVNKVVRSGQQVSASHNEDLIITASVSPGAELVSNGNIHIYGTMRGRAMAGQNGNKEAHIFCYQLTAELVAIAGIMMNEEELRRHPSWGKPAQISLKEDQIHIETLS